MYGQCKCMLTYRKKIVCYIPVTHRENFRPTEKNTFLGARTNCLQLGDLSHISLSNYSSLSLQHMKDFSRICP